jgi:hypothetical protein
MLGRPLEPSEHVHHRDLDYSNNWEENLAVLSPAAHMQLHLPGWRNRRKWREEQLKNRAAADPLNQGLVDWPRLRRIDLSGLL